MSSYFDWTGTLFDSPIALMLLACSVIMVGVALERWIYFRKRAANPAAALAQARGRLERGGLRDAIETCRAAAHPAGAVTADVLEGAAKRPAEAEEIIQVALSEQKLLLERNLGVLGSMATAAPLLGLMGTVVGIMRAFHDMGRTGSAAPSVVASGVSEALVTTAVGLVIAVPSVLLYNYFSRRVVVMLTVAENEARALRGVWLAAGRTSEAERRTEHPRRRDSGSGRADKSESEEIAELVVEDAAALIR